MFTSLQPVLLQRMLEATRRRKIAQLEKKRNSRVILLVQRQDTMRFLGCLLARYIDINDSEEVLRAIQMTDDEVPLDMVLHTPGRLVLAVPQIAQAVRDHKSKVTVFVPHYAMSGGTLVVLAADEIVMCKHSVLGAIDPQLGVSPGRVPAQGRRTEAGGGNRRPDLDPRRHRAEGGRSGQAGGGGTVAAHALTNRAEALAEKLATGTWTHDYPIWAHNGEGGRSASSHRHAKRSPRTHVALPAARAHARRRRGRVPCRRPGKRKPERRTLADVMILSAVGEKSRR
ncbi:MAG: hypothetical protein JO136_07330 [Hyphomicrobiales bacterium]|nr:hypothetical protein [Hyphomicrobiales bacterium]